MRQQSGRHIGAVGAAQLLLIHRSGQHGGLSVVGHYERSTDASKTWSRATEAGGAPGRTPGRTGHVLPVAGSCSCTVMAISISVRFTTLLMCWSSFPAEPAGGYWQYRIGRAGSEARRLPTSSTVVVTSPLRAETGSGERRARPEKRLVTEVLRRGEPVDEGSSVFRPNWVALGCPGVKALGI